MTYPTPALVASGVPYAVRTVNDRSPSSLSDFDGVVAVAVEGVTGAHVIRGISVHADGAVRLFEKSEDGVGKDVRTWDIHPGAPAGFTATPR
ncbi:hypothetical protein OMK64_12870 [Cellulomonas fimi]|uniref:hypothetical protein n=1 Tax=Cellulomonas fimi TaxID=1708 RepID=UPI00234C2349|nr:hypothetical protein [Cellulomonas fimi]MDC7122426.1 hypothetical protein [Cellulomonas fimi]